MHTTWKRILSALTAAGVLAPALLSCSDGGDATPDGTPMPGESICVDFTASDLGTAKPGEGEAMTDEFVAAAADFGFSMLDAVATKGNSMISPVSILYALGMTANGAVGETREQMQDTLFGGIEMEQVNRHFRYFADNLPTGDGTKLNIANSIWLNRARGDFAVNDEFLATNAAYYDAGVYGIDFRAENAAPQVNEWISDRTDKMIPRMLDQLDGDALMLLINTVLFDGKWEETYKDYAVHDAAFTSYSGKTAEREMLYSTENAYFRLGEGTGFLRPYAEKYSFVGILPDAGVDVFDYAASITGSDFLTAVTQPTRAKVQVGIPSFTFDFDASLTQALDALGMPLALSAAADFSGMGECAERIYISDVLHKTRIELTREGTKAAGATVVTMAPTSAPMQDPVCVYLDRPFVFAIVENESGLPVFCGIVGELE